MKSVKGGDGIVNAKKIEIGIARGMKYFNLLHIMLKLKLYTFFFPKKGHGVNAQEVGKSLGGAPNHAKRSANALVSLPQRLRRHHHLAVVIRKNRIVRKTKSEQMIILTYFEINNHIRNGKHSFKYSYMTLILLGKCKYF